MEVGTGTGGGAHILTTWYLHLISSRSAPCKFIIIRNRRGQLSRTMNSVRVKSRTLTCVQPSSERVKVCKPPYAKGNIRMSPDEKEKERGREFITGIRSPSREKVGLSKTYTGTRETPGPAVIRSRKSQRLFVLSPRRVSSLSTVFISRRSAFREMIFLKKNRKIFTPTFSFQKHADYQAPGSFFGA